MVVPKLGEILFSALGVLGGLGPGVSGLVSRFFGLRWTDYMPLGHRMPGTRFVAFKVPLTEVRDQQGPGALWDG